MDPDVMEIAPPIASSSKNRKQKQVALSEVIDVEQYEIHDDSITVLTKKGDTKNKGKAVLIDSDSYTNYHVQESASDTSGPVNNIDPDTSLVSHSLLDPDSLIYEDDEEYYDQYNYDAMDFDEYSMYQDLLDSKDIPNDVEVSIPWFSYSTQDKTHKASGSNSSHASNGKKSDGGNVNGTSPTSVTVHSQGNVFPHVAVGSIPPIYTLQPAVPFPAHAASNDVWVQPGGSINGVGLSNLSFPAHPGAVTPTLPPPYNSFGYANLPSKGVENAPSGRDSSRVQRHVEDYLGKFVFFKRFETVEDYSDHRFASNGSSSKQTSKNWAKRIQEEWRILEKDLPETIFVRVYESRMDLLRAVIIGAEGTPYHDGLFFFDVLFPDRYPNVPPLVHYHASGLRINPNLYQCGKVCLSLLGTWTGNQKERWIPDVSTMLQVLVSIQGLILNRKPYFNEPGYERMMGTREGDLNSELYSENTFLLSLKTMVYSLRRPPKVNRYSLYPFDCHFGMSQDYVKHFEDFVYGYFFSRAHDILAACKAYKEGAPVGCLVKGGVQDVEESTKSCSQRFRKSVAEYIKTVVEEFNLIAVKDIDKFLDNKAESGEGQAGPVNNYTTSSSNKALKGLHSWF